MFASEAALCCAGYSFRLSSRLGLKKFLFSILIVNFVVVCVYWSIHYKDFLQIFFINLKPPFTLKPNSITVTHSRNMLCTDTNLIVHHVTNKIPYNMLLLRYLKLIYFIWFLHIGWYGSSVIDTPRKDL